MSIVVSEPLETEHDIEKLRECLREKLGIRNVMREKESEEK